MLYVAQVPICIQGLSKAYGDVVALNRLDLEVQRGEILGFLGLNGAGKTTTIRILLDLLRPSAGRAFIFGDDCQKQGLRARTNVGYLPGEMGIYPHLTGLEVLDLMIGLERRTQDRRCRRDLQERLDLPDRDLRRRLREYSSGMKRKLGIIQAFQSDPPLLILDEPTESLDPVMQEAFYQLLADSKKRGKTVFMSSHVLSEVERTCDRVAVIRRGELALLASVEESRRLAPRRVRIAFSKPVEELAKLPPGIEVLQANPLFWDLKVEGPLGPLIAALSGLPINDLDIAEPALEDVVMRYYRDTAA